MKDNFVDYKYSEKPGLLTLAILQIGDDATLHRNVANCLLKCAEVGIACKILKYSKDIPEQALIAEIQKLNSDQYINGYVISSANNDPIITTAITIGADPRKLINIKGDRNGDTESFIITELINRYENTVKRD